MIYWYDYLFGKVFTLDNILLNSPFYPSFGTEQRTGLCILVVRVTPPRFTPYSWGWFAPGKFCLSTWALKTRMLCKFYRLPDIWEKAYFALWIRYGLFRYNKIYFSHNKIWDGMAEWSVFQSKEIGRQWYLASPRGQSSASLSFSRTAAPDSPPYFLKRDCCAT